MDKKTAEFFVDCEEAIQKVYTEGVELGEAEKVAAKFLTAQLRAGETFKAADLDARMKKTGLKAIKAGVYLAEVQRAEKKPSDVLLEAIVNQSKLVTDAQNALDTAETYRDELANYMNVFREGHIFFRKIMGGDFNG